MYRIPRVAIAARTILLALALVTVLALFEHLARFLEIVVLAMIVSAAMAPAVRHFQMKRKQKRLAAVGTVFALVLAVIGLMGLVLAPVLWKQVHALGIELPMLTSKLKGTEAWLHGLTDRFPMLPDFDTLAEKASENASAWLKDSLGVAGKLVAASVELVVVFVTSFFLLLEGPQLKESALALMPPEHRELVGAQIEPIVLKLGGYVQGMVISIAALTAYLAVVLFACQVPLALVLALLAGFFAIVPLIGGYIGLVPITLVALTVSWQLALVVLVLGYSGVWVVGHVLMPIVFSKSVHLSPLMVMLALLLGVETMGVFGALTAVPMLAAVQVLIRNLYIEPMERRYALADGRLKCSEPVRWHLRPHED